MNARQKDEQLLDILALRQTKPPSYVARKFGLTGEYVVKACRAIRDADVMYSDKKEMTKIMLHYRKP
jgi:hypothetical protein